MPDLNGIELARVLEQNKGIDKPRVVFTTAYNQFALEGYKVDALDYLLKPFNYEEFLRAANKALSFNELINQDHKSPEENHTDKDEFLFLKVEYQLVRIAFSDIIYIESLKDYVKVWLINSEKAILSLTSLKALEEKLPAKRFMRIHRSFIVSLDKIDAITRNSVQIGAINITVGDQYRESFGKFVSRWN